MYRQKGIKFEINTRKGVDENDEYYMAGKNLPAKVSTLSGVYVCMYISICWFLKKRERN